MMITLYIVLILSVIAFSKAYEEPKCSRFEYDIKTLEKMVKVEHKLELFEETLRKWEQSIAANIDEFNERDAKRNANLIKLEEDVEEKTDRVEHYISQRTKELNATIEELREKQAAISTNKSPQIAFTADGATGTLVNNVLTFKKVPLNAGNGYDKATGRFRCPVAGTYLFTATLLSISSRSSATHCYIRKNAANFALVYSYTGTYDAASASILFHLSVGDFVDMGSCGNPNLIHTGDGHTLFIGSLIQAD